MVKMKTNIQSLKETLNVNTKENTILARLRRGT